MELHLPVSGEERWTQAQESALIVPNRPQGSSLPLFPVTPVNTLYGFLLLTGQDCQPREETGGGGEASSGGDQGGEN